MADAYAPRLRDLALATPAPGGAVISPRPGVYAQVPGPQFETPAEIRMLRDAGADVVGMSMALETIAARHAGAQVLGLALVTNPAAAAATARPRSRRSRGRRRRGAGRGRHRPPRRRLPAVTNRGTDRRRPRRPQRSRRAGRHRVLHRAARPGAELHPARLRLPRRLARHGQRPAGPPHRGGGAAERRPALRSGLRRPRRHGGRVARPRPAGHRPGRRRRDGSLSGLHERSLGNGIELHQRPGG